MDSTGIPFVLSLSKDCPSFLDERTKGQGFDKALLSEVEGLSPNGICGG